MDRFESAQPRRSGGDGGLRARVAAAAARVFSLRAFLVALLLAAAGVFLGGAMPLLGVIGGVLGVGAAGFLLGLGTAPARYAEAALAGALAVGVAFLLDHLVLTALLGPSLVAFGAGAGLVAGGLGHYLGRDLRAGLTRDL